MPYASKAQQGFMHAKHPEIAKRWDKETDFSEPLPKYAGVKNYVSGGKNKMKANFKAMKAPGSIGRPVGT